MFTGIIEEVGSLLSIEKGGEAFQLNVKAKKVLEDVKLGDSISTNGVCLTVVDFSRDRFRADVMPETLRKSNLGDLKIGDAVNLERAMAIGDRFGGHMVSGHIDGMGKIAKYRKEKNATWIRVECDRSLLRYMIPKGSIAIDGTSLTLAEVDVKGFEVSIIPLTGEDTTLLNKPLGAKVNLECDMVGKYIEKFMGTTGETSPKDTPGGAEKPVGTKSEGITIERLKQLGY
jgi:riboflavin synthase